jgi:hypothetical protein
MEQNQYIFGNSILSQSTGLTADTLTSSIPISNSGPDQQNLLGGV